MLKDLYIYIKSIYLAITLLWTLF